MGCHPEHSEGSQVVSYSFHLYALPMDCHPERSEGSQVVSYSFHLYALPMDCHPERSEGSQVVSYSFHLYALHCQLNLILALNYENARTYFQLKCGSAGNSLIKKLLTLAKRLLCTAWLYASRQDW